MAAEDERVGVLDRDAELLGDERPESRRIEDAGHPEDPFAGESGCLHGDVAHRIERVGDDDEDRVRRVARRLLDDGPDDPRVGRHELVAAHARLAGRSPT